MVQSYVQSYLYEVHSWYSYQLLSVVLLRKGIKKGSKLVFCITYYRAILHPNAHDVGIHIQQRTSPDCIDHLIGIPGPMGGLSTSDSGTIGLQFGARNSQYFFIPWGGIHSVLVENGVFYVGIVDGTIWRQSKAPRSNRELFLIGAS